MNARILIVVCAVAFLAGGMVGWSVHKPEVIHVQDGSPNATTVTAGPETITITRYVTSTVMVPGPVQDRVIESVRRIFVPGKTVVKTVQVPGPGQPAPFVLQPEQCSIPYESVVIQKGAVVTSTLPPAATPAPLAEKPGWAVGVEFSDVSTVESARLDVGRRLFSDLWVRASAAPIQRQVGVGLEVHF